MNSYESDANLTIEYYETYVVRYWDSLPHHLRAMLIDRQKQTAACDMTPVVDLQTSLQPDCQLEQVPTPSVNPFINLAPTKMQPSYLFEQVPVPSVNPFVNLASTQLRLDCLFEPVPIPSCNPFATNPFYNYKPYEFQGAMQPASQPCAMPRKTARRPLRPAPAIPVSPVIESIPPAPRLSTDKCQPSERTSDADQQVPVLQPCQQPPTATTLNSPLLQPFAPKYFPPTYKKNSYVASLGLVYYFHYVSMTQRLMLGLSLVILRLIVSGFAFNSNRNPPSFSYEKEFANFPYDRGKPFVNFMTTNIIAPPPLQDKNTDRFTTFYYPQTNLSHHIVLYGNDDIISSDGKITASIESDNLYSLCAKEKLFITQCYNDDRDTTILENDNDINETLSDGDNVQIMTQTVYIDISYLVVPLLYSHLLTFIRIYIIVSLIVISRLRTVDF